MTYNNLYTILLLSKKIFFNPNFTTSNQILSKNPIIMPGVYSFSPDPHKILNPSKYPLLNHNQNQNFQPATLVFLIKTLKKPS
jgi:hypothetical protein